MKQELRGVGNQQLRKQEQSAKAGILKKVWRTLCRPDVLVNKLLVCLYRNRLLSDKTFLSLKFRQKMGRWIDWDNPRTFCEKCQWLKLYNRCDEYTIMADKVKVKNWVAERVGREYVIPTLGVWERPEDIDFDALPNRFVIKCNHNSGNGMYICKDKNRMNRQSVMEGLGKGFREDYFHKNGEWPYKNVPRRIIAEQFLVNGYDDELTDYKFYCFNGEPTYCQVIADRNTHETIDFYDMAWNRMPFVGLNPDCGNAATPATKPTDLETMVRIARELSKDIPFVRVDLYSVNGHTYFGETTFYPASGMGKFRPGEWDGKLGDLLKLPGTNRGGVQGADYQ